ncbi:MAG: hypothetical protein FJ405_12285 [Verrucomicrobia bacterium]|nr:hypothetical protein [Verrucomicrobiota bacterium]
MQELPQPSFSYSRKWSQRINVLAGILSLLAIVVMVNYLAVRRHHRFHLRSSDQARLSPMTLRLLGTLTNDVKILACFSREETLYQDVRELLREYKSASSRLTLEWVDPLRDPAAAEAMEVRYSIPRAEKAYVLFETQGRTKLVRQSELFDYDLQPLMSGRSREVKRKDFRGEMMFSSAIYSVTSQRSLKAYFLLGLGGSSPRNKDDQGFSRFAALIQNMGMEWETLEALRLTQIPSDCSLLVVVGPRMKAPVPALEAFQRYLDGGGRAFMLFDVFGNQQETGLEEALKKFGVRVGFDTVRDPESVSQRGGLDMQVTHFASHPVNQSMLANENAGVHLIMPRSIQSLPRSAGATEQARVEPLFFTSPAGVLEEPSSLRGPTPGRSARISEAVTNQPLAVAVERGSLPGVAAAQGGVSRLIAAGDSFFLNNQMLSSVANAVFAQNALNWLVDRSVLLGDIGPRPFQEFRLTMTRHERMILNWVFLGAMPGAVLFAGFLVWLRRRS